MLRRIGTALVLGAAAWAGDAGPTLEVEATSIKARRLREEADALWREAAPVWEKARVNQPVTPEEAARAVPLVEQAVGIWERALREEWNGDANRSQAQAVRAWYKLRPLVPPPPEAADEEARKKAEQQAERARRDRIRDVRRFVMDYGSERRASKQLRRCSQCEGRKDLRSPFGETHPCPTCARQGVRTDREAIVEAHWLRRSPLYREQSRHAREVDRMIQQGVRQPQTLAPFVHSVAIQDVEDHDTWVRVTTKEKIHQDPDAKRYEKQDQTYTLFRVGEIWYLHHERYDKELIDLTPPKKDG